jgi:hypothetical protein
MKARTLLAVALIVALSGVGSAAIITDVVRANGQSGDRAPIGVYTGNTAPMATDASGLVDGATVFSDRTFPWAGVPAAMAGSEYVRTFNNDKASGELDVTYTVTISQRAWVWVTVDDRLFSYGGVQLTQQQAADLIVTAFAAPGTFTDTGLDLQVRESGDPIFDRPMSVYATWLDAGTYVFGIQPSGGNFYTIGASAIPEPATLSLLGLGVLALIRRRR